MKAMPMTLGLLSRRTGVSMKTLRDHEDLGLIYTVGRSEGNYPPLRRGSSLVRRHGEWAAWLPAEVTGLCDTIGSETA